MKNAVAEIIAIGSELTTGAKLDTNSQWLSLALADLGIPTAFHSTVADDLQAMVELFRTAIERSDYVFITGGLGPTLDDLTRQAMAEAAETELILHEPSLQFIRGLFERRGRDMPERNTIQAMFPKGAEPLQNPRGTAPGIWFEVSRSNGDGRGCFIAMPGVPSEMKRMFEQEVVPRLPGGRQVIQRSRVNCFGLGESTAEEMLGDLTARGRDPEVGITVHEATITLRITAHGNTAEDCQRKIRETQKEIHRIMGDYVFGEEDQELHHVVVEQLKKRQLSLATVECGTGGLLAHRLTDCPSASECYRGGIVVPDSLSHQCLQGNGTNDAPIETWNSPETARLLAENCRHQFGTDFSLSITECPAFNPDETQDQAPRTFVALSGEHGCDVQELSLFGDPAITKSRAAKSALNLLRLHLLRQ
ncbi:MAG: molybdopterin-binding protein [Planctomycetaceae bacterium]